MAFCLSPFYPFFFTSSYFLSNGRLFRIRNAIASLSVEYFEHSTLFDGQSNLIYFLCFHTKRSFIFEQIYYFSFAKFDFLHIFYFCFLQYKLRFRAFDSLHEGYTVVKIVIKDVNDLPPKFSQDSYETTILEEDNFGLPKYILPVPVPPLHLHISLSPTW